MWYEAFSISIWDTKHIHFESFNPACESYKTNLCFLSPGTGSDNDDNSLGETLSIDQALLDKMIDLMVIMVDRSSGADLQM